MQIDVRQAAFQRNGVGGRGFYQLLFDWDDEEGETGQRFVGVVFPRYDEDDALLVEHNPEIAVLDPDNPLDTWRGADSFGPGLTAFLVKHRDEIIGGGWTAPTLTGTLTAPTTTTRSLHEALTAARGV